MTILEACIEVLSAAEEPMPVAHIHAEIVRRSLYRFGAKEPVGVVRATLRRHLRADGSHRVIEVSRGVFRIV
jgi:hypothetical protein